MPYQATPCTPIPTRAQQRIVTLQATNVLTIKEQATSERIFAPRCLKQYLPTTGQTNLKHYANPMVHPVTVETITSYKKAMKDPATTEIWQTAFGKEFGGMAQGDDKTKTKGTNAMFVMTHDNIARLKGKKYILTQALSLTIGHRRRIQIAF